MLLVQFEGYLGGDPEMKTLDDGQKVTNFSIANNDPRAAEGEPATWFRCTGWGKLGESVNQYLHKGSKAFVHGSLRIRPYVSNEGFQELSNDVTCSNVLFLDPPEDKNPRERQDSQTGGRRRRAAGSTVEGSADPNAEDGGPEVGMEAETDEPPEDPVPAQTGGRRRAAPKA